MAAQQYGLLLIPDISGFTEFVTDVEISHSEHIITELLELLINTDILNLNLCEIEGDALFFYREGDLPTYEKLSEQIRNWYIAFHGHLNLLRRDTYCKCGACQNVGNLGLKVVGHCGVFVIYTLKQKVKVIGKDVILVHRLLKNGLDLREYELMSSTLLEKMELTEEQREKIQDHEEEYPVLGNVSSGFVDLTPLLEEVPPTPPADAIPTLDGNFAESIEINASLPRVAEALADISTWHTWIEGLEETQLDRSAPIKPGHHHVCVFPDQNLSITIDQIIENEKEFTVVESIQPPAILRKLYFVNHAEKTNTGVRVEQRYIYSRKPIIGRIFEMKSIPMLRAQSRASLNNLKIRLEKPA